MSDMNGNPHYAKAMEIQDRHGKRRDTSAHQAAYDMACIQASATLALAYEQRTANLIALGHLSVSVDGPTVDISKDVYEIESRLGLNEGATE